MRPGWPTFNIQQALHGADPIEWQFDLATGTDSMLPAIDKVAIGVVMAQGDFPASKLPIATTIGWPIYGAKEAGDALHLAQAMLGTAPHDVDGKIVELPCVVTAGDYVLIATGVSDSIVGARRSAYATLGKLSMPNSPFWRIDIGQRLKKQLPDLQKHGFAVGLDY